MKNRTLTIFLCFFCSSILWAQGDDLSALLNQDDLVAFQKKSPDYHNVLILNQAIIAKAPKITAYLLEQNIELNAFDAQGKSPLLLAVSNRNRALVRKIVEAGAEVNLASPSGLQGTALMYAASNNDVETVRFLLAQKAKVNAVDVTGDHALNWATFSGCAAVLPILIQAGADLDLESKHGNAVDVCFRLWHADSIAQVFRAAGFGKQLQGNEAKIVQAVRAGTTTEVLALLKKNISANLIDELGIPLLHLAAETGNLGTIRTLVEYGADVNQVNRVGQAALGVAARFGHLDLVEYLINKGANPNRMDERYQLSPLIGAAINGSTSITAALLVAGAALNHQDVINQAAALHWAMFYNHAELAVFLVNKGADYQAFVLDGTYTGYSLAKAVQLKPVLDAIQTKNWSENPIQGSWAIRAIHYKYADTTYQVLMEYPGRLLTTPTAYAILYNPSGKLRVAADSLSQLTEAEMIGAFKSIVFNSGSYLVSKDLLVTTADAAKVPGFEGGQQFFKIEKGENQQSCQLTFFDEIYPNGERPSWQGKLEIILLLEKE
jgi:ankyrin repeat protein